MKRLKNKLLLAVAALSIVCVGTVVAKQNPKNKAAQSASFVFVMESNHAILKHINKDDYQLKLSQKDMHSVLAFSSQPNRISMSIPVNKFWEGVSKGPDSFDKDFPNLVVTWGLKYPAATYELKRHKMMGKDIVLYLTKIARSGNENEIQQGAVSVYIDSSKYLNAVECENACGIPFYSGGTYAKCSNE